LASNSNTQWPLVSVIIVNHNSGELLYRTVSSVLSSDYPENRLETIIIDNYSVDGSVVSLSHKIAKSSNINIIRNSENLGWCKAVNMGLKIAKGDLIACLNHDVEVTQGWLKEIAFVMKGDSKIAVCQCYSIAADHKTPDSAMNYLDPYGYAYCYESANQPTDVTFAEAMAWVITRDSVDHIGVIDEDIFIEYDDQDFCWRALLAGYRVVFVPSSIVYHYRGSVEGPTYFFRQKRNMLYVRNHVNSLLKNLEYVNVMKAMPVILTIEFGKAAFLFAKGKQKLAIASLRGLFLVLKELRITLRKRWTIQNKIRKIPDKEYLKYFVKFNPLWLTLFLSFQAKNRRLVIKGPAPTLKKRRRYR
jgi:GT2 family glycosyltransferase